MIMIFFLVCLLNDYYGSIVATVNNQCLSWKKSSEIFLSELSALCPRANDSLRGASFVCIMIGVTFAGK